jgi:transcriptional regulator NrdR family protein
MKCPACKHKEYRLSHSRNLLEKAAAVLGIGPVRCLRCQRRRLAFVLLHGLFS